MEENLQLGLQEGGGFRDATKEQAVAKESHVGKKKLNQTKGERP